MQHAPPPDMSHRNGASSNGSPPENGSPLPPAVPFIPAPVPLVPEDETSLDLTGIWNAFRRRWFLALSLGLLFGIPAAIGMWILAPAPYVTFAELRLNSMNTTAFPGSKSGVVPNFDIWKQAVLKRASHPTVLTSVLHDPAVQSAQMIREHEPHAVAWLEHNLRVKTVGAEYIQISLEGEHPQELRTIVNAVVDALVEDVDADLYEDRAAREKSLRSLVTEVDNSIQAKTTELENLQDALKVNPAEINRRQSYLIELMSSLRSALVQIEVERLKFQGQQQSASENGPLAENQRESLLEKIIVGDPRYQGAAEDVVNQKQRIASQERYLQQLAARLPDNHPNRVAAEKELVQFNQDLEQRMTAEQQTRQLIQQEVLADLPEDAQKAVNPDEWFQSNKQVFEQAFLENEKKLKAEIDEVRAEQQDLERYSIKGAQITREIEREQIRLERFQDELERLEFEIENTPTLIEMSREAEVPHARSLKKKTMLSGGAGLGVFGFFVAGIVFLEFRTRRIATLKQVSENLNLRVMGSVPLVPRSVTASTNPQNKTKNALWYSALTEAIDSTRTLLLRGSQVESLKTVMVASAVGGEGKTTMASHLATSLARGGRKILLIDCDLRRPCLHRAFDLPPGQGVCEILRGEVDIADCIQKLESPAGLSVLPAGQVNQQVLKMLALDSFRDLIEPLKPDYDFIVIDSSPLLPVTDGLMIAQHVDGVILSIRRDVSRISKVVMACQKLSMLGIPLLGAVTIGLQEESNHRRTYGYDYYQYGNRQHYYTQPPPV